MAFDPNKVDLSSLSQVSAGEDVDASFNFKNDDLEFTMSEAIKVNPDQHAKVIDLSKKTGVPGFAVEADVEQVEELATGNEFNFNDVNDRSPTTAKYLTNIDNAIIAQDDIDVMQSIEDMLKTPVNTVKALGAGVVTGTLGISEALFRTPDAIRRISAGVSQSIEDLTGLPGFLNPIRGIEDIADYFASGQIPGTSIRTGGLTDIAGNVDVAQQILGETFEPFQANITSAEKADKAFSLALTGDFDGFISISTDPVAMAGFLGQAVPSLVTSYLSGGSIPFIAWMESMEVASDAADFEARTGVKIDDVDFIQAQVQAGLVNSMLEKLVPDALLKGKAGESYLAILETGIKEFVTEGAQAFNTNLAERLSFDPDKNLGEGILSSALGGFGAGTTAATAQKTIRSMAEHEIKKDNQGQIEQKKINALNEQAEKSKLRERNKDSFSQFVKEVDGDNNTQVFIDGAQVSLYLQSKTADEVDADPALKLLSEKAAEASALGSDVQVPVADFATEVAGTEHYEQLRDAMTLSGETVSPFRQEQVQQETESYIKVLMDDAQQNASEYVEAQEIYNAVRGQLIDSGQVSPANASIMAQVVPAWATTQARRTGKTVQQVYQDSGLTVEGPQTGEAARIAGEQVLEQGAVFTIEGKNYPMAPRSEWYGDADFARRGGQIVMMNPQEYLDSVTPLNDDELTLENIGDLQTHIEDGRQLDPLVIYEDGKEDGRHRARAAINLGIDKVPVILFGEQLARFPDAEGVSQNIDDLLAQHTGEGSEVRGYYSPANSIIRLNEAADLSTFLHEFAHFMYEMELNSESSSPILNDINQWFKRNADDVAEEANGYLGDEFDSLKQVDNSQPESFGDWFKASKVVDDNGEPLVVYHGTDVDFTVFDVDAGEDGAGAIWFAYDEETAEAYSNSGVNQGNERIIKVYLKAERIFNTDDPEHKKIWDDLISEGLIDEESELRINDDGGLWPFWHVNGELIPEIKKRGFDAVNVIDAGGGDTIGVFNPEQIKSVENVGTFDAGDPDIFHQSIKPPSAKEGSITASNVVAFLDQTTTGDDDKDAAIRRAVHEQFARGFETYLMEGKAPSIELRNAFRAFARWLTQIYQSLRNKLDVNLDDQMRQVFDRLLATEEQIAAAESRARIEPMFTDAAMAGMTDDEFAKYKIQQEKVKDVQTETLRDKLINQLTRQTEKWWGEEKQDIINEEIESLKKQQVYTAREILRSAPSRKPFDQTIQKIDQAESKLRKKLNNKSDKETTDEILTELDNLTEQRTEAINERDRVAIKLDHATVKEMVGEKKTNKLGRTSIIIPSKLTGMTAKGQIGVHPDEAALFLGYGSGSEMLTDLITATAIGDQAEINAERRMIEIHGDILTDGTIEREADDAVQSEERGKLILSELKTLAKGTNVPTIDRSTIKNLAETNIGKLSFREIHPAKYRRAEIRAAQDATRMLAEGNRDGAATAKLRQVMNYYLGVESFNAKNETTKIVDRMARYNKKKIREAIIRAENGYWDQINKILNRFEFRKTATLKEIDNINLWVKERTETDGDGLVLANIVLNDSPITHWKNVPFSDLRGVNESVKNIEHVALYANKIKLQQEEIDFKKLKDQWVDHINVQDQRFATKSSRSRIDDSRDATTMEHIRKWASQLTKVPFLASWLDGGERVGMSHDILIQPFTDALDAKIKLVDEVATPVLELINNRSKEDRKRHNSKIWIPEINDHLMGHQVLAVALNTGNQGNLRKLLLGEGWADPKVETDVNFDNAKLQSILIHMNKNDWQLVQRIWDQMELLYPQLAEVHKRTTGQTPPRVESVPFVARVDGIAGEDISMRGGYYPVKYSSARSHKAEKNAEKRDAETDSMFNNTASIQSSVNTGATNERTGFYDRIDLSLEVVPDHFNETIHYITHHDAVRQVNRMIQAPEVADAITGILGEEEYKQLKPWLNDIAKDGRQQPVKTYLDEAFQRLRFGTTLGVMGFKASTGIMQVFGLLTTAAELGPGATIQGISTVVGRSWYMKAVRNVLGSRNDLQSGWDFATERSKVMSHRVQTMDREIRNAMEKIRGKSGILPAIQETSMKHIALIQTYIVDLPTWHAAYNKELSESGDESRAIKRADWSVENLQGSGATKDMATILRSQGKIHTTFTMFMTFFSALGNLSRDLVKGRRNEIYSVTSVAAKSMFLFTLPVFLEMLMRGGFDEPEGEDERLGKFVTGVALYPIVSVPFVRDVASGLIGDFGYNSSPVASMLEKGIQGVKQIGERAFTDEEVTKSAIKNTSKLAAAAAGIPGINQVWATGEHLYDVIEEGEEFTAREFLFGPDRK